MSQIARLIKDSIQLERRTARTFMVSGFLIKSTVYTAQNCPDTRSQKHVETVLLDIR
jgi:hypothetical protein